MISRYGFIIKSPDYQKDQHQSVIESPLFRSEILGVSSDEEAIDAARQLIANGAQVVELCGGFGQESAEKIITKLDSDIPVGFVAFSECEMKKLDGQA
ncbi:hypothetical protein A1OO_10780 [Enterovibrio norvegicus FF-33]|uniref:Uncharacterized protein n=1 Tax=Enterovibrio norvegicus FF-454 TaxID=1185651 RepID=A0A1E5C7U6_9GAMM|nr:DUF6506 family protein [Enterovibrio norvegicus]OEE61570.1 hypothetical protein A1OK_09435 [Enterovibrio norvegicus FF-454]OEE66268.1 hypothetical protein A1OO_10780 [Enterovibrio norvegicus FF-33]